MNSKQIVAGISAVVLIVILVYPSLSTGTISVQLQSANIENADHVYITVGNVWVHQAGRSSSDGWVQVSNVTRDLDLLSLNNATTLLAKGDVSVAHYDTVRIEITNVTWVYNKNTTRLQLESFQLPASLDFTVKAQKESVIMLILTGYREDARGTATFVPTLNATLTQG